MRRTSRVWVVALLLILGQTIIAAAGEQPKTGVKRDVPEGLVGKLILETDEPPKTGEKRDTLLYVRTDPPGAKVILNGKELGKSDDLFAVEPARARSSWNWRDASPRPSR